MMGGLQASDLIILAGRPGMGKTALATNIAYNIARAWRGEVRPDGRIETVNGGIVGFFSLEMSAEQLATRIIAEQTEIPSLPHPPRRDRPGRLRPHRAGRARDGDDAALHRRDRRPLDRAARRPRAPAQAPARPRPAGDRLHPAAAGLEPPRAARTACRRSPRSPPASRRWRRSSTFRSWRCRSSRARSRAATTSARSSPTCANRARSSRTPTW